MNPRLPTSKQWTALPKEYLDQIREVFTESFAKHLKKGELIVDGRIYPEEVLLRVGYLENGRLAQANFDASMKYSPKELDAQDRIYTCIDAVASMMEEYFSSEGEADFPRIWQEYKMEKQTVYLCFNTENTTLEAEANRLLGLETSEMVHEANASEDALEIAEAIKVAKGTTKH